MIISGIEYRVHATTPKGNQLATTESSLRVWLISDGCVQVVRLDQSPPKASIILEPISAKDLIAKIAVHTRADGKIYEHALNIVAYLQTGLLGFEQIVEALSETGEINQSYIERLLKLNIDDSGAAEQELIRLVAEVAANCLTRS